MSSETGPYLNIAAFCEQVLTEAGGVISLIRVVDRLMVTAQGPSASETMPHTPFKWFLVLNFKGGKTRGTHDIKVEPELPSGLKKTPFIFSVHFEGENRGTGVVTQMQMVLEEPGIYWFRIYLDNNFITQVPLEVIYTKMISPSR